MTSFLVVNQIVSIKKLFFVYNVIMDTCFFAFVADHTTVADSVEAPITSSDPLTSRKAVMSHKLKSAPTLSLVLLGLVWHCSE